MPSNGKYHLPQSEAEWLQTGKFFIEGVTVRNTSIQCAVTHGTKPKLLLTLSGGIPRDRDRQKNLPLINKLYGKIAVDVLDCGINSLLYHQPATGGSGGIWGEESLKTRADVLSACSPLLQ